MNAKNTEIELISAAIKAIQTAHPVNPPNLRFGAAVLTRDGNIYASSAFWSETLSLTLHAEHSALAHAAANNEREILAIASVSTEDEMQNSFCNPCGLCKQLIYESSIFSGIEIKVIMANLKGEYTSAGIFELCPFPWPDKRR